MTIALAIKVHDGIVLASDSAITIVATDESGTQEIKNIYNNGNKIFNLVKGLRIGGMAWGSGSIGPASIATLSKDLRQRFTNPLAEHPGWLLNREQYQIEEVAKRVQQFFQEQIEACNATPDGGFLVAGYSTGGRLAESWLIEFDKGVVTDPKRYEPEGPDEPYCLVRGEWDAVYRLLYGTSSRLKDGLRAKNVAEEELESWEIAIMNCSQAGLINEAMPIRDAIELGATVFHTPTFPLGNAGLPSRIWPEPGINVGFRH